MGRRSVLLRQGKKYVFYILAENVVCDELWHIHDQTVVGKKTFHKPLVTFRNLTINEHDLENMCSMASFPFHPRVCNHCSMILCGTLYVRRNGYSYNQHLIISCEVYMINSFCHITKYIPWTNKIQNTTWEKTGQTIMCHSGIEAWVEQVNMSSIFIYCSQVAVVVVAVVIIIDS